jgi:hypothetical protein
MPLSPSEDSPQSGGTPVQTTNNRRKMTLGNQAFEIPTDPGPMDTRSTPLKNPVDRIPSFIVWSIFNLLLVPFGILCCYFTYKIRQYKAQNRIEMANKWSKRAFVLNIITTLLMFGLIITAVMLHYDSTHQNSGVSGNQTLTTGAYIPWQPGR